MGTGEFLRMVAPESMLCISTNFSRAEAELASRKLWVTYRATGDLICTALSHPIPIIE